jgi:hypothetical protein
MKQFEPSSLAPRGVPSHVADAGKIVLGAGVRLPVLNGPAPASSHVAHGADQSPAAKSATV